MWHKFYAEKIRAALKAKAGKLPEAWDEAYQAPVYYYLPGQPKNATEYTQDDMAADRRQANAALACPKKRGKAFKQGHFACLLLADSPQAALKIEWDGAPIVLKLIELGLFHIVKDMVARAGHADMAAYFKKKGLDKLAYKAAPWERVLRPLVENNRVDLFGCYIKMAAPDSTVLQQALDVAIARGHTEMAQVLLENGAVPQLSQEIGAAAAGDFDMARLLKGRLLGALAIEEKGHLNDIDYYSAKIAGLGADVLKFQDAFGETCFLKAVKASQVALVAKFLQRGADTGLKDNYDFTALMYAAQNGHEGVVGLLLEKGANVGLKDKYGITALMYAALKGHEGVVGLLLAKGADVGLKGNAGFTALIWAAQNGHEGVVGLLLAKGADVGLKNNDGSTALTLAAQNGHEGVIKRLLAKMTHMDITKDDTKIFKSSLRREKLPIARLLNNRALEDYIATTSLREDNDKRHSFTLFNKYKLGGFGYSALQKKNAAQALYDVVHNGADMDVRCSPKGKNQAVNLLKYTSARRSHETLFRSQ